MKNKLEEYVIVASVKDPASINIANSLIDQFSFDKTGDYFEENSIYTHNNIKLIYSNKDLLYLNYLDHLFNPRAYIFLSHHRSEKSIPCLTAHFPGLFTTNVAYGGLPEQLSITYPSLFKKYIINLWGLRNEIVGYQVTVEPMHHGPTNLTKPVLFIEIGSTETQWVDKRAGKIVAKSLWTTLQDTSSIEKVGIGFGGPHYSTKFTDILVNSEYSLGAIAPKYSLGSINRNTINNMISRCLEPVKYALVDWKGLGKEKKRILKLIEERELKILRV